MDYTNKTGYIFLKVNTGYTREVFEQFKTTDWVIGAWAVTGDYDLIVWVNAKTEDDLYRYANSIREWKGVEMTNSHYVHDGFLTNFETLTNPNGAWVRLRVDTMKDIPTYLKNYNFVGSYASIPGEYDYLVWTNGETVHETIENVLTMTKDRTWRTYTHIPVYTYFNENMNNVL